MKCEQARKLFSPFYEGELPPQYRLPLEEHLEQCDACTQRWESLRSAVGAVQELPRHPVPRSFGLAVLEAYQKPESQRPEGQQTDAHRFEREGRPSHQRFTGLRWAAIFLVGFVAVFLYVEWRLVRADRDLARVENAGVEESSQWHAALGQMTSQLEALGGTLKQQDSHLERLTGSLDEQKQTLASQAREMRSLSEEVAQQPEPTAKPDPRVDELRGALGSLRTELVALRQSLDEDSDDPRWNRVRDIESRLEAWEDQWQERWQGLVAEVQLLAQSRKHSPAKLSSEDGVLAARARDLEMRWALHQREQAEVAQSPCRVERQDGRLRLLVNWDHPDAVTGLFGLFEGGDPGTRRLALDELDRFFAAEADAYLGEDRSPTAFGFVGELWGERDPAPAVDEETRRVEYYRQVWNERQSKRIRAGRS